MKIGPVDIRNHTFPIKMRGLDEGQVRAFLDVVADRLEELIEENRNAEDAVAALRVQLTEYSGLEKSLRNSLVSAERVTEERLAQAEREARLIIKNAEVQAERMLVESAAKIAGARGELQDLHRQKVSYAERFRALLRSQARILEASVTDFGGAEEETASIVSTIAEADVGEVGGEPVTRYLEEEGLFSPSPGTQSPNAESEG